MAWYSEQVQWVAGHDYNNPENCSPDLAAWFSEMRQQFPALNGPLAGLSADESKIGDYSIGRSSIYACFAWSEAINAHQVAFELAKKHGAGFFNVSEKDGEVCAPQPSGLYACIHGTGAAFASNPEVRVISIAKAQVIKSNKS